MLLDTIFTREMTINVLLAGKAGMMDTKSMLGITYLWGYVEVTVSSGGTN